MNTVTNLNIIPLQPVDISLHIQITSLYATSISLTNMYFFANSNSDSDCECAVWHCNATATNGMRKTEKEIQLTGPLKAHLLTLFNIKTPLFQIKPTFEMLKNAEQSYSP